MSYKISVTGIRDPQKVKDLVEVLSSLTRLQAKTVASYLKDMPYELPIFHDEAQMKEAYTQLQNAGAAIELVELSKSKLGNPDIDPAREYERIEVEPEKIPRAPYNYKMSKLKGKQQIPKPVLYIGVGIAALILIYSIFAGPSVTKTAGKQDGKKIGVKASELPEKKVKAKKKKGGKTSETQGEAPDSDDEDNSIQNTPESSKKAKAQKETIADKYTPKKKLAPNSMTGQGIPEEIDANSNEGRYHLAILRENKAENLKKKAQSTSVQEKIALLKQSLNLDPYDNESWSMLKSSLQEAGEFDQLKKVQGMEQKMVNDAQLVLEDISRSIGGVETKVEQKLSEVEFEFSKTYTQGSDFTQDAKEVFQKFRIKYPDRRIVIKDRSGRLKIHVAAGDKFPLE